MIKNITTLLHPRNHNTVQKVGLFISISVFLIAIFLHNPFSGYLIFNDTPYGSDVRFDDPLGNKILYQGHLNLECLGAAETYTKSTDKVEKDKAWAQIKEYKCYEKQLVPFSEWQSYDPIVSWLGNLVNLIKLLSATLILGIIWLAIFRSSVNVHQKNKES